MLSGTELYLLDVNSQALEAKYEVKSISLANRLGLVGGSHPVGVPDAKVKSAAKPKNSCNILVTFVSRYLQDVH